MYDEEIARGVAVLNERVPDWRARIDVDALRMDNVTRCVVGQVLDVRSIMPFDDGYPAGWPGAITALSDIPPGPRGYTSAAQREWTRRHGFDTIGGGLRYDELTQAWKDYLRSEALV